MKAKLRSPDHMGHHFGEDLRCRCGRKWSAQQKTPNKCELEPVHRGCNNPALILKDLVARGGDAPDEESFAAAAAYCDEDVVGVRGTAEGVPPVSDAEPRLPTQDGVT